MALDHNRFAIFRIIGNSLPPRHSADNVILSTQYILENEKVFQECDKVWILNKIVDRNQKQSLLKLLRQKKQKFVDIPFDADAHFSSFLDNTGLPVALRFALKEQTVHPRTTVRLDEWRIRHKSQKLVGINDARNTALRLGRAHYEWSVIADGGVVFTEQGWKSLVEGTEREPQSRIAIIPMYRVYEWKGLDAYEPRGTEEEPQIAFHRTSEEIFDPTLRYGNQNKGELLARIGVPGPWQAWHPNPWDNRHPLPAPNFRNFAFAGFVYRLPTDGTGKETKEARRVNRFRGVQAFSFKVDLAIAQHRRDPNAELTPRLPANLSIHTRESIASFVETLQGDADLFVTDKKVDGPGGNRHDYFSLAPHYSSAGLKYDGYRNEESSKDLSDASAFRSFAWKAYACAVAGVLLERAAFKKKAVSLIESWFVDPATKMTPSARYAQRIPGRDVANDVGIIELRQLAIVASAAKLLRNDGALHPAAFQLVSTWFEQFLDDCGSLGIRENSLQRQNNIGTWSAVLFGSLDLFCGRFRQSFSIAYHASERLGRQLGPFAVQLNEIGREKPLHYCLFNLGAWYNLSLLCRDFGIDLLNFSGVNDENLGHALDFCWENRNRFQDYKGNSTHYDSWMETLRFAYGRDKTRRVVLVPTPHWGLPPIVFT